MSDTEGRIETKCSNPECRRPVPASRRECLVCLHDNGYPNVRQALAERDALEQRLRQAEAVAESRGCLNPLLELRKQARTSVAVITANASNALRLLSSPYSGYQNYYWNTRSRTQTPRTNWFDEVRGVADDLLFPNYRDDIIFAALSLDGLGCSYYGPVHMVLADFAIRDRATVFEENSLYFCEKHRLGIHKAIPAGYRASWTDRDRLAAGKLEARLQPTTLATEMPGIVLSRPDEPDSDFLEVHIYGTITRESLQKVIFHPTVQSQSGDDVSTVDNELFKSLIASESRHAGICFEEVA